MCEEDLAKMKLNKMRRQQLEKKGIPGSRKSTQIYFLTFSGLIDGSGFSEEGVMSLISASSVPHCSRDFHSRVYAVNDRKLALARVQYPVCCM